jgi:hypothetical protein
VQVAEGLYVSGAAVAQDRAILAAHGISHVVNCVGALYSEYFRDDSVAYRTLWLQGEQWAFTGSAQVDSNSQYGARLKQHRTHETS